MKKTLGSILLFLAIAMVVGTLYRNSRYASTTRPFSTTTIIQSSWNTYKERFINNDGRVVDYSQNSITTSEGQSYALLQAVFLDDKGTFDKVWLWTKNNLKRPNDALFSWHWGQKPDGSYGTLEGGGENSATDADTDIALSLLFASYRWSDPSYQTQAQAILDDIWRLETDTIAGKRYVIAGNWAKDNQRAIINPSYIAPYAYRIFARYDTKNDWLSLIQPSYDLLTKATQDKLDKEQSANLPPDWIAIQRSTGTIEPTNLPNLTTNYSYDALRVPWRLALDYIWFNEPLAKDYLQNNLSSLAITYTQVGALAGSYSHDGKTLAPYENPALYATTLPYFMVIHPSLAEKLYQEKILTLYSNGLNAFKDTLPYYEYNWLWFGAALYTKQIPLLSK